VSEVREVFLLGAGFSHVVSKEMPLTKKLGEAIKTRAEEHCLTWAIDASLYGPAYLGFRRSR